MERMTLGGGDFQVEIWSLGACVNDLRMPDRGGDTASVVLGYGNEDDRRRGVAYIGEICGPYANRIAAGGYVIDGQVHTPDLNDNGTATLHGGADGWNRQDWSVVHADQQVVRLRLDWHGPADGFPGPVHADIEYRVEGWSLTHTVKATTDSPTVLSIVSHPYFDLSGGLGQVGDHRLQVAASSYLPVDEASIPLPDAPSTVEGTPFDFRQTRSVADALASQHPQMLIHGGLDHALVLDHGGEPGCLREPSARLSHPASGRWMDIRTDYPALQVYSGQFLGDPALAHPSGAGRSGSGIALETEEFPDAPRRPDFPSVVIRPGQTYSRTTTWEFGIS